MIDADRLDFVGNQEPWEDFVKGYHEADIALDPFPYSGWITTCDALRMGIPVVTLSGETSVGRGGASILANLGLPELVAQTPEEYLDIAVSLAHDLPRLSALRSTLRERMERSPLRDARGLARAIEAAYRSMWREYCVEASPPVSFQVPEMMDLALAHHRGGRISDAENSYRQILAREPRHAEAWHLLGVLAGQVGRNDMAIDLMQRALALNPGHAQTYRDLGVVLQNAGDFAKSIAVCLEAVRLDPLSADHHYDLANGYRGHGQIDEAIAAYRQAVQLDPAHVEAHNNLGNVFTTAGRLDEAIAAFREALRLRPEYAEVRNNLGNALQASGEIEEAMAAYREALRLKPDYADAAYNLGIAELAAGHLEEAIAALTRATQLNPDHAIAYHMLGKALQDRGQFPEAVAACQEARRLDPGSAEIHNNLANALHAVGRIDEALLAYAEALRLDPSFADAWSNLSNALSRDGQPDQAIAACREALRLKPDSAVTHNNLGNALVNVGRIDEAIEHYRRAVALEPGSAAMHSNLVYGLCFHPGIEDAEIVAENERWYRRHAQPLEDPQRVHVNDRSPERRLRIGYLSPDLRRHVVGWNLLPLLREHDHKGFEIFCYADVPQADGVTEEFESLSDHWRTVVGQSAEAVAEMIRADRIDILVDVTLHMDRNPLLVFARRPAPVQVSYLASSIAGGLRMIDYRFSDAYLDPVTLNGEGDFEGEAPSATGPIIRLPHSAWCYQPSGVMPEVAPLPALSKGYVCFGSRNNFAKVSPAVLDLWMQVIERVADSRLFLFAPGGSCREAVKERFQKRGLSLERLEFAGRVPWEEFLRSYERVDIVLDPFPYSGWITSCDAVAMGVPVVSLGWRTVMGRGGKSILSNIGLPELVAETPGRVRGKGRLPRRRLPRLSELRSTLRERMKRSPLRDATRHARDIEVAYRRMWRNWCADRKAT